MFFVGILAIISAITIGVSLIYLSDNNNLHEIQIGNTTLLVEYAISPQEWVSGLSNRDFLPDNQGLLFISSGLELPGFWMKDMRFPIDIIWIRDTTIIGIEKNVPVPKNPSEPQETYRPPQAVTMVLEVNAGWSDKHAITVGDTVTLSEKPL